MGRGDDFNGWMVVCIKLVIAEREGGGARERKKERGRERDRERER